MKIQNLIQPENVYLDLEAVDAESGMAAVAQRLGPPLGLKPHAVVDGLMERERLGSTSVGNRFAIPHCKIQGIHQIVVALARFREAIDFGPESGGEQVALTFVVLSPPDQPAAHLQVLSQIARVLKRKELRSELIEAADAEAVIAAIRRTAESEGL
ncbi:MAG: PTS sugar transporter subunit IIA [Thermoanaerobaculales bacterium]